MTSAASRTPSLTAGKAHQPEHALERTEVREARLQQVESDERGEQKPRRMHPVSERERRENENAGKAADDPFLTHDHTPVDCVPAYALRLRRSSPSAALQ